MAAVGKGSMLAEDDALPSDAEDDVGEPCDGPEASHNFSRHLLVTSACTVSCRCSSTALLPARGGDLLVAPDLWAIQAVAGVPAFEETQCTAYARY